MRRAHATAALRGTLFALLAAACGGGASSPPPPPAPTPVAAPSGAAATTLSAEGIQITWTDRSADETGFELQWSLSGAGPFTHRADVGPNVTTYDDGGLGSSGTYFYRVRATRAADVSGWSSTVSATTQDDPLHEPSEPSGAAATAVSASTIRVTWLDGSSDEAHFEVERAPSFAGPFAVIATVNTNVTAYEDGGLGPATTWFYRIHATNAAGASIYTSTVNATTQGGPTTPPAPPTGLAATVLSASAIRITWTDASTDEGGFEVERAASAGGPFVNVANLAAGTTRFDGGGLAASTTYFFRVRATNAAGASSWSSAVSATTQAAALAPPAAPTGVAARALSASAIRITWTDASADETAFEVERASAAGGTFAGVATLAAGATQVDSAGLAASTAYLFRVRATNAAGASGWSGTASATTLAAPIQTVVLYPVADNRIAASLTDDAIANTPYAGDELIVGCNWLYNSFQNTQGGSCFGSAVKFDVAALRGRSIEAAALWLWVYAPPLQATAYDAEALAGAWGASLTWNTLPNVRTTGGWRVDARMTAGPLGWSMTEIVRNWASGAWANDGVVLTDANPVFPNASAARASSFYSSDYYSGLDRRPQLVVDYR